MIGRYCTDFYLIELSEKNNITIAKERANMIQQVQLPLKVPRDYMQIGLRQVQINTSRIGIKWYYKNV